MLDAMPSWLASQPSARCTTQREFAERILPILRKDKVYVLPNGVALCGVCHRALRGIKAVHSHFDCLGHTRTPRVAELRRIVYKHTTKNAKRRAAQQKRGFGDSSGAAMPKAKV